MSLQLKDRPSSNAPSHIGPFVDWTQSATALANLITFLGDEASEQNPPARIRINGTVLQVTAARAGGLSSVYPPGTIIRCDTEVWVQAGTGHVVLEQLIDASESPTEAADYCQSQNVDVGDRFDLIRPWHEAATRAA